MSDQEIARMLECPSCFEYMFSPIYICSAGHSICRKCKAKIRNCPTCRCPFNPKRRNYSLEHISVLLSYPCPHEANGCSQIIKYAERENHGKSCPFRPYPCIIETDCDFVGPRVELINHYREKHPESSWMGQDSEDRWDCSSPKCETQVAFCYGEMFYFHRILEYKNMYWACQFIGKSEDASNFVYKLSFDDSEGRIFSFRNLCQSDLVSTKDLIRTGRCVGMQMPIFETFMGGDKTIRYIVTIEGKSQ